MKTPLSPALVEFMHVHQYRPEPLKPSGGGFLRFAVGNEINGNASGYVKVFPDGVSAVFGDFKSGTQIVWNARDEKNLGAGERQAREDGLRKVREEIKEESFRFHAAAADKAAEIYANAKEAKAGHPYLVRKGIKAYGGARELGSRLVVPVYVRDKLASLQFIEEDGAKRFLSGSEIKAGCCVLGTPVDVICIAEGYATGCSIHEATGHAVAVAFNAGNLMQVARVMRQRYKEAALILCADNDRWTEDNPGLARAMEAAIAVDALLAVPDFMQCDMSSRPTDFNDLHMLAGQEAVRQAIAAAHTPPHAPEPAPNPPELCSNGDPGTEESPAAVEAVAGADIEISNETEGSGTLRARNGKDSVEWLPLRAQPQMAEAGFVPLLRDTVQVACDSSEAHRVAVAVNMISCFSALVGRGVFQRIGDAVIHCRPFMLIVGKSGKARKGTSEVTVMKIVKRAEAIINERNGLHDSLKVYKGALSTGEGIAMHIRDAREADGKGRGADPGVPDKRLLAIESEFENFFSHVRRDNNNLSATIRTVFDGHDIKTLTKTDPISASRPHVCIIGHITGYELRLRATENDVSNGLLNRFLIAHVYRPKLVALPQPTPEEKIEELAQRVADMVMAVTNGDLHADNAREVVMSDPASQLWEEQYNLITRDREGKGGSLLARSEMYARMLAMIFAAMDGRLIIEPCDFRAAIAWVEYWSASITYVFNCEDDEGILAPFVAEVLENITKNPGITLTALQRTWLNKRIKAVRDALEVLLNRAPPLIEQRKEATGGRSALRYFAYEKK
jgi:phage/plasmid primase-like uncharacterized protein